VIFIFVLLKKKSRFPGRETALILSVFAYPPRVSAGPVRIRMPIISRRLKLVMLLLYRIPGTLSISAFLFAEAVYSIGTRRRG
jgi:hypothetical protein